MCGPSIGVHFLEDSESKEYTIYSLSLRERTENPLILLYYIHFTDHVSSMYLLSSNFISFLTPVTDS